MSEKAWSVSVSVVGAILSAGLIAGVGVYVDINREVAGLQAAVANMEKWQGTTTSSLKRLEDNTAALSERIAVAGKETNHLSMQANEVSRRVGVIENKVYIMEEKGNYPAVKTDDSNRAGGAVEIADGNDEAVTEVAHWSIPLDAGWKAEGSGAVGADYRDGVLRLRVNLQNANEYAELFLDLQKVDIAGLKKNADDTYDLAGKRLSAVVTSDSDFSGNPAHLNGAQWLVKNAAWESLVGQWLHANDAKMRSKGMEVYYEIPDRNIAGATAGICLKFTIGSNSDATFEGTFAVHSVRLTEGDEPTP